NFLDLDCATAFYERAFSLLEACRANLPLQFYPVRYENVIADVEGEARKLIAFLDLPWDERVLRYREHALARPFINTPSYHQVVKPLYTEARDRWVRYRPFLEPYLERLRPACKTLGYDL
ncbi:MAG TPA: sulfotransferase, partial [Sphingomonadales bacterium]|nr:sulfotransferase [Sphingomonadales bacterium]